MLEKIKDKLFLIINYLRYKFAVATGKYPKGIEVNQGRIVLDLRSKIILDGTSSLKVSGELRLNNSTIRLMNSDINFSNLNVKNSYLDFNDSQLISGKKGSFSDTVVKATQTKFNISDDFNIKRITIQAENSIVNADQFLLIDGKYNLIPIIIVISSNLNIGSNVNIKCKLDCRNSTFTLGNNIFINHGSEVRCHNSISIGSNVLISYECLIFDTNTHSIFTNDRLVEIEQGFPNSTKQSEQTRPKTAPIFIGDNVWIGMRAAVLKGSRIGNKSVVGLMTVVSGDYPENSLITGNPGKLIRTIN